MKTTVEVQQSYRLPRPRTNDKGTTGYPIPSCLEALQLSLIPSV